MRTRVIEAVVGQSLWSVFLVGLFDHHEQEHRSPVDGGRVLRREHPNCIVLFDLGTKEGAVFNPSGHARSDIREHAIWTSPLFEAFLTWLRGQFSQGVTLENLPSLVELPGNEATESVRHKGPLDALIMAALKSSDREVQAAARAVWTATYNGPAPGVPVTLAQVRQWLGA